MDEISRIQELNDIISELLTEYPLYRKMEIPEDIETPWDWNEKRIKFYCKSDESEQTFKVQLPPELSKSYAGLASVNKVFPVSHLDHQNTLNFVIHVEGHCTYCKKYRVDFMINIFKDREGKLYARKIGMYPPIEISPGKDIMSYLDEAHQDYYKKALMNLSHGYGVGAFAYLRRITEDVIKRIVQDIIELQLDGFEKVKDAWEEYQQKWAMSTLIDQINPYIPSSLMEVGDNPLRLLYSITSQGIHDLSDDECLDRAHGVDTLLQFIISKMNEEKSSTKKIREAVKKLKSFEQKK